MKGAYKVDKSKHSKFINLDLGIKIITGHELLMSKSLYLALKPLVKLLLFKGKYISLPAF